MNTQVQTKPIIDLSIPQDISIDVLLEKYAKGKEKSIDDVFARVSRALATNEKDRTKYGREFLTALNSGFLPAGRIISSAGAGINATLINCFVQPVGDSFSAICDRTGKPGIYKALWEAGETMRRGGGVGYNFSDIRPRGSMVKGTRSYASGPVSYMHVFDKSCATVESAGARRGAQMGVLIVAHPDIREFIRAKRVEGALVNFNVSVGITNAFMQAVKDGLDFKLVHAAEPSQEQKEKGAYYENGIWVYEVVDAKKLYDEIMQYTYDFAEPGVIFLDRMNEENNLRSFGETIEAMRRTAPA